MSNSSRSNLTGSNLPGSNLPEPPGPPLVLGRWLGRGLGATIALLAALAIGQIQQINIRKAPQGFVEPALAQEQRQIALQLLRRLPTLGFDNAIANWAFLDYLQYFGDGDARAQSGYGAIGDYFDLIVARDPRFLGIYPFLSAGVSYYAGQPERSIALMLQGTNALSPQVQAQAFWVWRFIAFDQFLLLGDTKAASRSFDRAADWAAVRPESREYEPFFRRTAGFLRRDPNSLPVRFYAWYSVYAEAIDRPIRDRAERELILLGAKKGRNRQGQTIFFLPGQKIPGQAQADQPGSNPP